jgi:hypothetical protein
MGKDKDLKIKDKKARTTWGAPSYGRDGCNRRRAQDRAWILADLPYPLAVNNDDVVMP